MFLGSLKNVTFYTKQKNNNHNSFHINQNIY